jgi:hypothetical protein
LLTRADLRRNKKLLFKTNKTKNTTIKNNNRNGGEMMGTGQRWHVLEEMGGTTP